MKLIDKDALVAEIEKIIATEEESIKSFEHHKNVSEQVRFNARIDLLRYVLSFLDTIETKEAASIWNDARKTIPEDGSEQIICIKEDNLAVATIGKIVCGTKKWAYLNDLLNIFNAQVKEADLDEEVTNQVRLLNGVHTLDDGKQWWKGTYNELSYFAKYFFELGLKIQKGE